MTNFHHGLTEGERSDPHFAYRVEFVPKLGDRASNADLAVKFVKADSEEARDINRVLLKEVDKPRYTAKQIVAQMQAEAYPRFNQHSHTSLWKELHANDPAMGFGRTGDYKNTWVWQNAWLARVRAHCQEQAARYT
ncbi:MAG TPA: hypothetical protein VFP38_16980 [Bradyrhizobium sp.]|nr:hypothetical protein [Bradyrhizobium sp.]